MPSSNLDLSGFYLPPADLSTPALKLAALMNEQAKTQQELAILEQDKKDARAQQNRMFNLREINDLTDLDKYKTGQQALDAYSQKTLKGISDNAMSKYINLDPAEMEYRVKNDMNQYIGWHNAVSSKLKETEGNLTDFNKTYPNIDYEKAKQLAHVNLISDFVDPQTGERKVPANMNRNYVEDLHNPDVLAELTNDVSPREKYYSQGLKPFHASDFTSIAGVKNRNKFSGYYDPGKNSIVADKNGNPTLEVNNEVVPGVMKDGEPLKMIDQNQYQNIISTPGLANSMYKMWKDDPSREGKAALDNQYLANTGKPMDDNSKEAAFRHWLYLDAKKNLPSYINQDKAEVVPVTKNTTNINLNNPPVNDIHSRIEEAVDYAANNPKKAAWYAPDSKLNKAANVSELPFDESGLIVDFVNKAHPDLRDANNKPTQYNAEDLYVLKGDDGKLRVYNKAENVLGVLPKVGTNIKVQTGVKGKNKVVGEGEPKPKKDPLGLF